jgi:hypothetical protein
MDPIPTSEKAALRLMELFKPPFYVVEPLPDAFFIVFE